jgi:hypothetical protein
VVGINRKINSAIRKEDDRVTDGPFWRSPKEAGQAISVKESKVKEFHDTLGRMATFYKRQNELVLPAGPTIPTTIALWMWDRGENARHRLGGSSPARRAEVSFDPDHYPA